MLMQRWARSMLWIGVVGMLIALLDPMEGAFIALPFCAILSYAAHLSGSGYRRPLYWALGSMAVGVAILVALSLMGGIGGSTGRSMWWALLLVHYPLGWLAALFLGARMLREPVPPVSTKVAAG